ncbi:hypothetical protein SAMN04487910_0145 [Aquimarina amphilecti]|uniref:DUF4369 domain-containing protein n=1 Tax=Aquimarina amphilecti TaxID=1038014 RepID=A0A1H7FWM2_AQUAM|nr:hypothetical protein [Aquimarina amphilecti]SEK27775.1 hypothetical protein SAMN04487910_0145 [Aquimarina amphilecti]
MRYLLISIFCVSIFSCKVATVENFIETEVKSDDVVHNPYFSNAAIDYVYKSDISVYGNEFSGILILKRIAPQRHRIVFTSQFGSTFFDIEIGNESYKIHSIVEQLNRKIILNTLIKDFSLLIKENGKVAERYHNDAYNVLKNENDKYSNYYFYNIFDQKLDKIVNATKRKEKVIILFNEISEDQVAENIRIDHKNIRLNIELNFLKK